VRNEFQTGTRFLFWSGHNELCYSGGTSFYNVSISPGFDRVAVLVFLLRLFSSSCFVAPFYVQDIAVVMDQYAGNKASG
jgi:hypothetical protein